MIPHVTYDEMRVSVAFTGYRPSKLPYLNDLNCPQTKALYNAIYMEFDKLVNKGYRYFLTGGALGSDMLAAEAVGQLKQDYKFKRKNIAHELCLPCADHTAKWKQQDKERLDRIMKFSMVTSVSNEPYSPGCMQRRNEYMVDTSSVLVAVYDGISGGTKNTVEYAKKKQKKIIIIRPNDMVKIRFIDNMQDVEQLRLDLMNENNDDDEDI